MSLSEGKVLEQIAPPVQQSWAEGAGEHSCRKGRAGSGTKHWPVTTPPNGNEVVTLAFGEAFGFLVFVAVLVLLAAFFFGLLTYARARARRRALARSGIFGVDQMSGGQFEPHLIDLFHQLGYRAWQTDCRQGDNGGDIIVEARGVRHIVQAKRWSQSLGQDPVRQAIEAKAV